MLAGAAFLRERTMSARAFAGLILTVFGVGLVALKPEEQESAAKEGEDGKARAASGGRLRRGYVMMMLVRPNVHSGRETPFASGLRPSACWVAVAAGGHDGLAPDPAARRRPHRRRHQRYPLRLRG